MDWWSSSRPEPPVTRQAGGVRLDRLRRDLEGLVRSTRWWIGLACVVLGSALIVLGERLEHDYWAAAFLEIGAAFLLVFPIAVLSFVLDSRHEEHLADHLDR
jgi:hypothetical protein